MHTVWSRLPTILVALFVVATSCSQDNDGAEAEAPAADSSIGFLTGECPTPDRARASRLAGDAVPLEGPRAVGGPGDVALVNDRAAFVISAPVSDETPQRTWYHYGGIVVDAAAVGECRQVSPDRIDEVGLTLGRLDLGSFDSSILRAFRADTVEVIDDGSNGEPALVRAAGTDDRFQLIEYQLIRATAANGGSKPLSEPLGVRIEVDYVLAPGDPVLRIDYRVVAEEDGVKPLLGAAIVSWGDDLEKVTRPESSLDVGGFDIGLDMPWQAAHGEGGSYAFGVSDATQGIASIAGVEAFVDTDQALGAPLVVDTAGASDEMTFLLSVGPEDANSATVPLVGRDPALGAERTRLRPIEGSIVDPDGSPVGGARIDVEMRRDGDEWAAFDVLTADDAGRFEGDLVVIADDGGAEPELRLRVRSEGRADMTFDVPGGDGASTPDGTLGVGPRGSVEVDITDGAGHTLPARLSFYDGDGLVTEIDTDGSGTVPVQPGDYALIVSRGYEYDRVQTDVDVLADAPVRVEAQLTRVVDTRGWVSLDTHVHTAPSPDSTLDPGRRMLDAAATGLEVVVNTEHEIIEDISDDLDDAGLGPWVASVTGQEVTASSPEHTTMYPVEPDGTARGGNPLWYGRDLGEIYALEAERGASVRGLNHPAGYLDVIDWDPVTATPGLTDPTIIGLEPDATLWSWDVEQVELQNGRQPVLRSSTDDEGLFDFWQSIFNHGERVTGVAASDAHGLGVGEVWTYVKVPDDDPSELDAGDVSEAIAAGRAVLSTGAFAEVDIDGAGPGDTVSVDDSGVAVGVRIQAAPGIDVDSIRVFANCDQIADVAVPPAEDSVRFDDVIDVNLSADAHITVLGFGSAALPAPFGWDDAARVPRFTANPIFVDVDGNGDYDAPGDKACSYPR